MVKLVALTSILFISALSRAQETPITKLRGILEEQRQLVRTLGYNPNIQILADPGNHEQEKNNITIYAHGWGDDWQRSLDILNCKHSNNITNV